MEPSTNPKPLIPAQDSANPVDSATPTSDSLAPTPVESAETVTYPSSTPDNPASEPELSAHVDNLMATSAAAVAEEAALTSETAEPQIITPQIITPSAEVEVPQTESRAESVPVKTVASTTPVPTADLTLTATPIPTPEPLADTAIVGGNNTAEPLAASAVAANTRRSWKKPAIIAASIFVVIGLVSAAVFAEVIIPNRPDYVLSKALENSLQAKQVSYKGTIEADNNGTAISVKLNGAQDNDKQASDIQVSASASGLSLPVEARLVDKNAYIKFGDLTPIVSMLSAFGDPAATPTYTAISQQLSNKWISVDSTLLKQAGISCVTDTKFVLTKADSKLLEDQLKKNQFVAFNSNAADTVNGQKVTKYVISVNDDKAVSFANSLDQLSLSQALNKCSKETSKTVTKSIGDHKTRPLTIWVNKGTKQIVQIAMNSVSSDPSKVSGKVTFSYDPVSITAPTSSTPLLEVIANLQKSLGVKSQPGTTPNLTSLFSGLSSGKL